MRAVFRFDASPRLGAGHAYRCLTLAEALHRLGWHCHAVTNPEAAATVSALRDNPALSLSCDQDFSGAEADLLVVDHYGLDAAWETGCRSWAKSILVIDDLADRHHDCDLLIDQTFGRQAADYDGLVPSHCRVLTGSDYALLRPGFAAARSTGTARHRSTSLQRLLVSFGATDPENYSLEVMKGVAESDLPLAVDVVLGAGAPHLGSLRDFCTGMPQKAELHVDVTDMPALLTVADLAVGAAGTSTWERGCLGLPSLLVVIAENQRLTARSVSAAGAARLLAGPRTAIAGQTAKALRDFAGDPAALRRMSAAAAALCDGRGVERAALALVPPGKAKDGQPVALRLADAADEEVLLAWQRDPVTRRFARNPAVPSAEEHQAWFTARLADPDCLLTIITLEGTAAGMVRLDAPATAGGPRPAGSREVSILVAPEHRGLGIASEALDFLRRWQGTLIIAAEVLPGNTASTELFRAAGYKPGPKGLFYSHPIQSATTLSPSPQDRSAQIRTSAT